MMVVGVRKAFLEIGTVKVKGRRKTVRPPIRNMVVRKTEHGREQSC